MQDYYIANNCKISSIHPFQAYNYIIQRSDFDMKQIPNSVTQDLLITPMISSIFESQRFVPNVHPFIVPFKYMKRKSRSEKNPVPNSQKDEKYFERRKRNNEAAKKSRDARKLREDKISLKAALLERENAILKSQILALQEEVFTLAQMICMKDKTLICTRHVQQPQSFSNL
ncbi:D site-binding protein [Toxorhynchites rutilus septentrionalis]|uniref:D site-binding protein n=1 Tax=Toxorhynchites rutilus septentrionalis TaxID=329112 RepID=UPI00247AA1F5|nr:D site-binding protein [Toxorhynchites rutilus septentrionalis]